MPNSKLDLDKDLVRKLAKLLEETGLSEIEYAEGDKKIRVSINQGMVSVAPAPVAAAPAPAVPEKPVVTGTPVASPMVGPLICPPRPAPRRSSSKATRSSRAIRF